MAVLLLSSPSMQTEAISTACATHAFLSSSQQAWSFSPGFLSYIAANRLACQTLKLTGIPYVLEAQSIELEINKKLTRKHFNRGC